MDKNHCILSVNGGSSSIKFSLYRIKGPLEQLFYGEIENIGTKNATLNFNNAVEFDFHYILYLVLKSFQI